MASPSSIEVSVCPTCEGRGSVIDPATCLLLDCPDCAQRESQRVVPDAGDDDGHFPGITDDDVKTIVRKLEHIPTRQWTYVMDCVLPARLVRTPNEDKDPNAPFDRRLTDAELRLLLGLVRKGNKDLSDSFPSVEQVAKKLGFHLKVARRLIRSLQNKGWIRRNVRSPYDTIVNQFCVPPGVLAEWHEGWTCPVVLSKKWRGNR